MENTNNVSLVVHGYGFNFESNNEQHVPNLFQINLRILRTFSHEPQIALQPVEDLTTSFIFEIPEITVTLPLLLDPIFWDTFRWIDSMFRFELESSGRIEFFTAEISNYTRDRVIPSLHASGASSFHLLATMTMSSEYNLEEMLLADEIEEVEMDQGSSVPEFVLERLRKSSFLYEEKVCDGSLPVIKIGVGDECSVCLQEFSDEKNVSKLITCLPCGHIFHQECIFRWLQDRNNCPYCRGQVE